MSYTLNPAKLNTSSKYLSGAAGKVGASDGRPRKGQDPADVDAPGFEMEVAGGALKGQPQKGQLNGAGGTAVHLPESTLDEVPRRVLSPS